MRFPKVAFRPVHISRLPLSIAGFLGCIVCLAWNVLIDRGQPEQPPDRFGFGRPATQHEIDSEAIAIAPNGHGLPQGHGDSATGAPVYKAKCAACHGATGREGPFQKLVGDTGKVKTIGNYWPYATTVFDYIRRAMPLNAPGTLDADEVYGLTAYLLSANKIITRETVLDARTLPAVDMPAKNLFVTDPRRYPDARQ
jgi:S-disulfanyl-L-cysteine oxidoreductase SoxD